MIRTSLHSVFNLAFKIALLIVLTNLLYSYFTGRAIAWEDLLALDAPGDKLVAVARGLVGVVHQILHGFLR